MNRNLDVNVNETVKLFLGKCFMNNDLRQRVERMPVSYSDESIETFTTLFDSRSKPNNNGKFVDIKNGYDRVLVNLGWVAGLWSSSGIDESEAKTLVNDIYKNFVEKVEDSVEGKFLAVNIY